jgi:hypothetical protein
MGMQNSPRATQWALAACAMVAAVAYGASWLGMRWVYDITVNGASFQLGPRFPLGLLVAALMAAAGSMAAQHSKARLAPTALTLGAGCIFGSALFLLLVWAPGGAPAGQEGLLQDATRLGFALLALTVPLALPAGVHPAARLGGFGLGLVLAPMIVFPEHVQAAGLGDIDGWPMVLFFFLGLLALSGSHGGGRWSRRSGAHAEGGSAWMRAGPERHGKLPRLRREPMFDGFPGRPHGPDVPGRPSPLLRRLRQGWDGF